MLQARCSRRSPRGCSSQRCGSSRGAVERAISCCFKNECVGLTVRASTYSWHGTSFMLANRASKSIFSRISEVSPLTRRVKKLAAQPEPNANMLRRLPRSSEGATEERTEARQP
jgi:hypothetical protein